MVNGCLQEMSANDMGNVKYKIHIFSFFPRYLRPQMLRQPPKCQSFTHMLILVYFFIFLVDILKNFEIQILTILNGLTIKI